MGTEPDLDRGSRVQGTGKSVVSKTHQADAEYPA